MRTLLLIILLFSFSNFSFGQKTTSKIVVYFEVNKFELKDEQLKTLNSLNNFTASTEKIKIILKGYTDSDADSLYNLTLSKNRVNTIRKIVSEKFKNIETYYYGEKYPIASNNNKNGKSKNRRVEIEILYDNETLISKETTYKTREIIDTCSRDTLIYLPEGSNFSINICDYFKYKSCLRIKEYLNYNSIINSDLTTLTTSDELLSTDGMLDINICNYGSQLVHPLIFRVPVGSNRFKDGTANCDIDTNYKSMTLWIASYDNKWGNDKEVKVVKIKDTMFYEFNVSSSGKYNFDYKVSSKNLKNVKTKIKAKGISKLLTLRLLTPSPRIIVEPKEISNNKAKFQLNTCPQGGCNCILLAAIAINENGDTLKTSKCLDNYEKRKLFGKCKFKKGINVGYFLGIFAIRKKGVYRKYIINTRDWTKK